MTNRTPTVAEITLAQINAPRIVPNFETAVYDLIDGSGVWLCCFDTLQEARDAQQEIVARRIIAACDPRG